MTILAIDSSAVTAGCAVVNDERLLASGFVNIGLTHSQTLMDLIARTLSNSGLTLGDIDCVAVSNGPGSFTGVRIGVAAAKGIAFTENMQCAAVSTLEAIAYGAEGLEGYCCAVMDARREQVYNAIFRMGEVVERVTEDRAVSIEQLGKELEQLEGTVWLCGDGARLCFEKMSTVPGLCGKVRLAPEQLRYQNGCGVARAAQAAIAQGLCDGASLSPVYLRLPQAERELRAKKQNQ